MSPEDATQSLRVKGANNVSGLAVPQAIPDRYRLLPLRKLVSPKCSNKLMSRLKARAPALQSGGATNEALLVAAVFGLVNIPSIAVWAGFGAAMSDVLRDPVRVRVFNIAMALALVGSLYPVIMFEQ